MAETATYDTQAETKFREAESKLVTKRALDEAGEAEKVKAANRKAVLEKEEADKAARADEADRIAKAKKKAGLKG